MGNTNRKTQTLLDELEHRAPFSYDAEADPLYRQYREQYQTLGRQAMEDTVGQAAGLTGGYGSSYGEAVGQQTYQAYLDRLNDLVPDLYAQRRAAYDRQTDDLYTQFNLAHQLERYADERSDAAYKKALAKAETLAAAGDYSGYAALGYTQAEIARLSEPWQQQTGGAYSSSYGGGYGNCGLSDAQIKELQQWLGVAADGQYGPKSQAAAEQRFGSSMSAIQAWIAYQKAIGAYGSAQPSKPLPNPGVMVRIPS